MARVRGIARAEARGSDSSTPSVGHDGHRADSKAQSCFRVRAVPLFRRSQCDDVFSRSLEREAEVLEGLVGDAARFLEQGK